MSAPQVLPGFVPLRDTWSGDAPMFASESAARWFIRTMKPQLAKAEAVALRGRELYLHGRRATEILQNEAIGNFQRRAGIDPTAPRRGAMSSHQPTPWSWHGCAADGWHVIGSDSSPVCLLEDGRHFLTGENRSDEMIAATARRIVACVNFCEGVGTDALEGLGAEHLRLLTGASELRTKCAALEDLAKLLLVSIGLLRDEALGRDDEDIDVLPDRQLAVGARAHRIVMSYLKSHAEHLVPLYEADEVAWLRMDAFKP